MNTPAGWTLWKPVACVLICLSAFTVIRAGTKKIERPDNLFERASELRRNGKPERAEELYLTIADEYPKAAAKARTELGALYFAAEEYEEAIQSVRAAQILARERGDKKLAARAEELEKRYRKRQFDHRRDELLATLDSAENEKEKTQARLALADLYRHRGMAKKAEPMYRDLLKHYPDNLHVVEKSANATLCESVHCTGKSKWVTLYLLLPMHMRTGSSIKWSGSEHGSNMRSSPPCTWRAIPGQTIQ